MVDSSSGPGEVRGCPSEMDKSGADTLQPYQLSKSELEDANEGSAWSCPCSAFIQAMPWNPWCHVVDSR